MLELLAQRRPRDLASVREQFVPWLIKGAWQKELNEKWAPSKYLVEEEVLELIEVLNPPRRDPFAAALARSTTAKPSAVSYLDESGATSPSSDRQVSLPPTGTVTPQRQVSGPSIHPRNLDLDIQTGNVKLWWSPLNPSPQSPKLKVKVKTRVNKLHLNQLT